MPCMEISRVTFLSIWIFMRGFSVWFCGKLQYTSSLSSLNRRVWTEFDLKVFFPLLSEFLRCRQSAR